MGAPLGAPAGSQNSKLLKGLVGERGFEPPTPWSRTRCSTRLSHSPTCDCALGVTRCRKLQNSKIIASTVDRTGEPHDLSSLISCLGLCPARLSELEAPAP